MSGWLTIWETAGGVVCCGATTMMGLTTAAVAVATASVCSFCSSCLAPPLLAVLCCADCLLSSSVGCELPQPISAISGQGHVVARTGNTQLRAHEQARVTRQRLRREVGGVRRAEVQMRLTPSAGRCTVRQTTTNWPWTLSRISLTPDRGGQHAWPVWEPVVCGVTPMQSSLLP